MAACSDLLVPGNRPERFAKAPDGRMVDRPVVLQARRTLGRAGL